MHNRPLSSYSIAVTAWAQPLYNAALEAALVTDQTAGKTAASDAVKANGVDHDITIACLEEALGLMIAALLPRKILAKVKQSLRRDMQKPKDMKVCTYYQNLVQINNKVVIPNLPPCRPLQKLGNDELIDIVLFRTPKSWQSKMDQEGFEQPLFQVVDFMERVKSVKEPFQKPKSNNNKDAKKKSNTASSTKEKPTFFCSEHGPNFTHDTKDCKVLANKKSGSYSNKKKPFGNKTWTCKAGVEENSGITKKELPALVQKAAKKEVKKQSKELASISKKHKNNDFSSDDKHCFLLETLIKDLNGFNYEQMENLKIEDGNKVSC
jgi:hypothetical protein